jgi:hypothetical protein
MQRRIEFLAEKIVITVQTPEARALVQNKEN